MGEVQREQMALRSELEPITACGLTAKGDPRSEDYRFARHLIENAY